MNYYRSLSVQGCVCAHVFNLHAPVSVNSVPHPLHGPLPLVQTLTLLIFNGLISFLPLLPPLSLSLVCK